MTIRTFTSIEDIEAAIGDTLGTTAWRAISQDDVDAFADVTGDHQWIHIDQEKAKDSSFGGTIVHGFLTLSFIPVFASELYSFEVGSARLNFGLDRVRFLSPLPVGDKIRGSVQIAAVQRRDSGTRINTEWVIERSGSDKPVCIAESITLLIK